MMHRISLTLSALIVLGVGGAANAAPLVYFANLSGSQEVPPTGSPGTGFARVTYDAVARTLRVEAQFSGLTGNTTAAHIHAPINPATGLAGVATQVPSFDGFPLGVTSGVMDNTFDLTLDASWNPAFITNNGGTAASAEAAFAGFLAAGRAYFNIHTTAVGSGEIRGNLTAVPEPSTLLLGGLGVASLAGYRLRRRRRSSPTGA
jgi:hypothetical protein